MVLVNPEIVWASEEKRTYEEGCLSIPEYYEEVERPARVRFRYTDLDGETVEQEADGLLATCVQHEIDHLERRAVHRPPVEAEARPGDEEIQESAAGRRRRRAGAGPHEPHHARRLHGHAGFRRARRSPRSSARATRSSAVYTRAPAAAGRGMELRPSPVQAHGRALRHSGADADDPARPRTRPRPSAAIDADVAVVVAYGMILPKAILEAPRARLPQPARLAPAALARRGADPARRSWPATPRPASR